MVRRNDNSVGRSEHGLTLTKKFKHSQAQVEFLSSPNGEGNGINSITNLSPYRPNALTPYTKLFQTRNIFVFIIEI